MQLIGHNPENGATCFFETALGVDEKSDALTVDEGLVRGTLPAPGDPGAMSQDYEALRECAEHGPNSTSDCSWRDVPGG